MRVLGVQNLLTQPLYDTMQAAAVAGQTLSFYSIPLNGPLTAAINKTYAHTNVIQAGRLEKGVELTIKGISFAIRPTIAAGTAVTLVDYKAIYEASHINMQIGQVSVLRLPLNEIPAGCSENQYFSNIAAAATEFQSNHGLGAISNVLPINPLVLEENETIQVDLFIGGTVAAVTNLRMVLWGDMTRPVR
jgi:hypothetical protein